MSWRIYISNKKYFCTSTSFIYLILKIYIFNFLNLENLCTIYNEIFVVIIMINGYM